MVPFPRGRAAVVVLGDIGRSPRMCLHALALAQEAGLEVDLIGYAGTQPHATIANNSRIHIHAISPPFTNRLPRALYLLSLPFKLIIQVMTLFWVLCVSIPAPDFFILQNPPSIPTLTVAQFACWLRGSLLIIDWHNFGYTLLGLTLRPSHPLVKIHYWYERRYGKNGAAHLCVTQAMQLELEHKWGIRATVLYDKPANHFRPILLEDKHELFVKLNDALTTPLGEWDCCSTALRVSLPFQGDQGREEDRQSLSAHEQEGRAEDVKHRIPGQGEEGREEGENTTGEGEGGKELFTSNRGSENANTTLVTYRKVNGSSQSREKEGHGGEIFLREDRPAIIISSTSWTADEDFGILLEAATLYDRRVAAAMGEIEDTERERGEVSPGNKYSETVESEEEKSCPYPRLLFIITGKGPQKAMYEEKIVKLRLKRVAFRTIWLEAEDYPLLLGSSDLGVSLHLSSSGLDLPMKVVDMFGCGLPVAAMAYSCIGELVKEGENGVTFSTSFQLVDLFLDFFKGFPSIGPVFLKLKEGSMVEANGSRWVEHWRDVVLPLLVQVCQKTTEPEPEEKVLTSECSSAKEKPKSGGGRKDLRKKTF